jgi:hypothetical protein
MMDWRLPKRNILVYLAQLCLEREIRLANSRLSRMLGIDNNPSKVLTIFTRSAISRPALEIHLVHR